MCTLIFVNRDDSNACRGSRSSRVFIVPYRQVSVRHQSPDGDLSVTLRNRASPCDRLSDDPCTLGLLLLDVTARRSFPRVHRQQQIRLRAIGNDSPPLPASPVNCLLLDRNCKLEKLMARFFFSIRSRNCCRCELSHSSLALDQTEFVSFSSRPAPSLPSSRHFFPRKAKKKSNAQIFSRCTEPTSSVIRETR